MSLQGFTEVLLAAGLQVRGDPVADGKIHRVCCNCRPGRDKAGWYFLRAVPFPHGWFGCWRCSNGEKRRWSAKDDCMLTAEEREQLLQSQREHEAIEVRRHAETASKIRRGLPTFKPAEADHPYLIRKCLGPNGLLETVDRGQRVLVVSLHDAEGVIWNVQHIYPKKDKNEPDKFFEKDARVRGMFHAMGDWRRAKVIVICEGWATGASIFEATALPVICAMNRGNLLLAAEAVRKVSKTSMLLFAADDDSWTPGNPGVTDARRAAKSVRGEVLIPQFKDRSSKPTDFNDLLVLEGADEVKRQIEAGIPQSKGDEAGRTSAQCLVSLCDDAELFHDGARSYATVSTGGHKETWPIKSMGFKEWLSKRFLDEYDKVANRNALADAITTLAGLARHRGARHEVFIRVARLDGQILIDLCDPHWRVIKITAEGWMILDDSPVKFIRSLNSRPMIEPVRGGSVGDLWKLINVNDRDDRISVLVWLVTSLGTSGPYFVLLLHGEQGSAKSSGCRAVRSLVDPAAIPLSRLPDDEKSIWVSVWNNYVLCYENISHLPDSLSDALCSVATGGGLASRTLYSDGDETLLGGRRPILLNGIPASVTRPDLADRTLGVRLERIEDEDRRREAEMALVASRLLPGIFGGLLDALVIGMKREPDLKLPRLPRMADAAYFATACEPGLGLQDGDVVSMIDRSAKRDARLAVESSRIATICMDLARMKPGGWNGTYGELLRALNEMVCRDERGRSWPESPRGLSAILRRHSPALRRCGVELFEGGHGRDGSKISLIATSCEPPPGVLPDQSPHPVRQPAVDDSADLVSDA